MCERQIDHNSIFFHATIPVFLHIYTSLVFCQRREENIGILLILLRLYVNIFLYLVDVYYSASVSSSNISLFTRLFSFSVYS